MLEPSMGNEDPADDGGRNEERALTVVGGLDAQLDRKVQSETPSAFLLVSKGDYPGRVYPILRNTVTIGRDGGCDIRLFDASVSSQHARIIDGALGFEVQDLESTNGTYVDDEPVQRSRLRNGQRLRVGAVEFTFLRDRKNEPTEVMIPTIVGAPRRSQGARAERVVHALPRHEEESGPSLSQIVRKAVGIYEMLRRHAYAATLALSICSVLAVASVFIVPAGSGADATVKLHPAQKTNPVDDRDRPSEVVTFFAGADRAFTAPELVDKTLKALGGNPTAEEIDSVAQRLKFELVGDQLYQASYKEGPFSRPQHDAVAFLGKHITTYIQDEIDKTLAVFVKEVAFLRSQTDSVEKEMSAIDGKVEEFKKQNAELLPDTAAPTVTSREALEQRRVELVALIHRLQGELAGTQQQLSNAAPLAQARLEAARDYKRALAEINQKLAEKRAQGLADTHPDIEKLIEEQKLTESLIEKELNARSSSVEQRSGLQGLQGSLQAQGAQLAAAKTELVEVERNLQRARKVVGDMPRVEAQLSELMHTQEATRRLHAQLFDRLRKAEVQLELERVSVASRYEILSVPRLNKPHPLKTLVLRLAIGLLVGLLITAGIMAFREVKPMVQQALDRATARSRHGAY
jgi:uncharacterized protein involved in exopolysaccharide biosynthesis